MSFGPRTCRRADSSEVPSFVGRSKGLGVTVVSSDNRSQTLNLWFYPISSRNDETLKFNRGGDPSTQWRQEGGGLRDRKKMSE